MNAASSPIAEFSQLVHDRYQLDLSPIELAEILWLANQRGIKYDDESVDLGEPRREPVDAREAIGSPAKQNLVEATPVSETAPVNVVVNPPIKGDQKITEAATPLPIQIPAAVALRNRREIAKGLRPLMRKVPSRSRQTIDEEATARQIAEDQIWTPVVQPEAERWLELAIVIEVTNLVDVWQESIAEFQHLLERHGAFRDVRTWQLQTSAAGEPQLFLQTANGLNRNPRSARELLAASGRRLVLLISDCTSQAWRSGKMWQLLQLWSRENPVTIGQLLPERYWDRSALGLGSLVTLQSALPGARSRDWLLPGLSALRFDRLREGLRIPVITIQPQSIGQWAGAMAAVGTQQSIGVVLRAPEAQATRAEQGRSKLSEAFGDDQGAAAETMPLTAQYLVQRFRSTASAKARRLAEMMAVLPVNWSVLRLLQKNLVEYTPEDTGALYLAEIFLSGLLRPVQQLDAGKFARQQYDFVAGVRSVLLGGIPIGEARAVGEKFAGEIFRRLPVEVQERVNRDIERRWQGSLGYFEAFLVPDLPWGEEAEAEMLPFAQVTDDVLRRWGGEYAAWAEELKLSRDEVGDRSTTTGESTSEDVVWQTGEVEVITIEFNDLVLERYEFEVATLRMVENVLELQDVLRIANQAMKAHAREDLNALQREIIEGIWHGKSYGKIADEEGFSRRYVNIVGETLFRILSEELKKSITKKNMVTVFGQIAGKPIKAGLKVVRVPGAAEQFVELLAAGDALETELAMVRIPAGAFMMGSPEEELERLSREGPQRIVTVPEFYMGKYPVTQAQWRTVANLPVVERDLTLNPSRFSEDDNLPVERVSWYDAVEFCRRLSDVTGRVYRLPSEAEWEYACRGRTATPFHFGDMISPDLANYRGEHFYGHGQKGIYRVKTTVVGSLNAANFFGLHDMHGNVFEWCLDHYHDGYEGAPTNGAAWINSDTDRDAYGMVRGGCWYYAPHYCRSACRSYGDPNGQNDFIGFRVVCEAVRTL